MYTQYQSVLKYNVRDSRCCYFGNLISDTQKCLYMNRAGFVALSVCQWSVMPFFFTEVPTYFLILSRSNFIQNFRCCIECTVCLVSPERSDPLTCFYLRYI
jgi:hypothetical protein